MTARKDLIMEYYIAYGSNLNVEQMKLRCPGSKVYKKALMNGWKLTFRRTYLNIEPDVNSSVDVVIWKITKQDELNLDRYEGYPRLYDKEYFAFTADGKIMTAMVYRMDPERFPIEPPRPDYLQTVADGYRTFKFDVSKLVDIAKQSGYDGPDTV